MILWIMKQLFYTNQSSKGAMSQAPPQKKKLDVRVPFIYKYSEKSMHGIHQ